MSAFMWKSLPNLLLLPENTGVFNSKIVMGEVSIQ